MGLFDKKTPAEKQQKAEEKEQKKEARQDARDDRKEQRAEEKAVRKEARDDRQDARQDYHEEKKDARKDAHAEKKDARQDARAEKKDGRQEKRADMKEIRQSDLKGEAKHDAKKEVRDEKHDAIHDVKDEKHEEVQAARETKKDRKDEAKDEKKDTLEAIEDEKLDDMAAIQVKHAALFDGALALELLALTETAQNTTPASLASNEVVTSNLSGTCTLNGATVRNAVPITRENFKSDTECFVAHSDNNELVVAFRGSETSFFDHSGAFRDWVLTDFRSNAIEYPPAPKIWPDRRWVHAGFWEAYDLVRGPLLSEVGRQAGAFAPVKRIFVTGFSLGGALALLAALDIADAMRQPVELFTFAAPRAGHTSLNKLLKERVAASTLIAFRGDPVVHLPPLGPNFPVTFRHPVTINVATIHIPLGNPVPQLNQQYRTADNLFYINKDGEVHDSFPVAQIALNFNDHNFGAYDTALRRISEAQGTTFTATSTPSTGTRAST